MLNVKNLSFSYQNTPILSGVSFDVKKGEIVSLVGSSGSGKTTLFKLLTGVLPLQSGEVTIHNQVNGFSHSAYMMQEDLLLPWRTVLRNVTLPKELGPNPSYDNTYATELLTEVGLGHWLDKYPNELSGGMRQRVSLARALIENRPLLLLDEPFGALDVCLREQMYALLKQIQQKYGTTIVMVTHDFRDALEVSNRVLCLNNGKLTQEWEVTAEIQNNPQNLFNQMRKAIQS